MEPYLRQVTNYAWSYTLGNYGSNEEAQKVEIEWTLKLELKPGGSLHWRNARLVANKGCNQVQCKDSNGT